MKQRKWKPKPYIKTQTAGPRLVLRPYNISDFKKIYASHMARLPAVNKYDEPILTSKEIEDLKKYKEKVYRHRKNGKDKHHFVFGIFSKKDGAYIGQVDLFTFNKQLRWANLGYHIQNQFFGKGYASEAASLALKIGFRHLNFYRIEASMEIRNKASQKVAMNCGLQYEGIRKKFFPQDGGVDLKVFATNAIDYRKKGSKSHLPKGMRSK